MFALFAFYHDNYSSLLRKRIEKILVINLLLCYLEKTMLLLHDDEGGRIFCNAGSIPPAGVTQTLSACVVRRDTCSFSHQIEVKNCTTFLVYKLKPLRTCYEAYCFGNFFFIIISYKWYIHEKDNVCAFMKIASFSFYILFLLLWFLVIVHESKFKWHFQIHFFLL